MKEYDHNEIEPIWQEKWEQKGVYDTPARPSGDTKYVLDMFPYPSGSGLHVGHVEGYTGTDTYARFCRMSGKDVLHPMGWDAFGLPAENYAMKTGTPPREKTEEAIETFKSQIKRLGLSYDWSHEINTSEPDYYGWTQWLFTKLFENDLAYKKPAPVNWCPSCQTVLANEQVIDGRCERCDSEVVQKEMDQWFFKITDYSDRLIDDLDQVDWPESTKKAQKNWIGKKTGARFHFPLANKAGEGKHIVLLHGFKSSPSMNFHPWLKSELEAHGHTVEVPELPNSKDPEVAEQVQYVLENINFTENTILLGHSLGTVVAIKVLEELDAAIEKTVLVAPFIDSDFADGDPRSFSKTFDYEFDFEAIKNNTRELTILQAEDDESVSEAQTARVEKAFSQDAITIPVEKTHAKGEQEEAILPHVLPGLSVFTTRPDTLFGATYLALSPEHQEIRNNKSQIRNWKEVTRYVKEAKAKSERERQEAKDKTGVKLEGVTVKHPATGEEIPVYVADYVLAGYGTGAIMAVPAHDERDFEFANEHDIEIRQVISEQIGKTLDVDVKKAAKGVIVNDDHILLVKEHHNEWSLPGGTVEEEECIEEALVREVQEETGLSIQPSGDHLGAITVYFDRENGKFGRQMNAYVIELEEREEPDGEHETGWFTFEEAKEKLSQSKFPYGASFFEIYKAGRSAYENAGVLINSEEYSGFSSDQAAEIITKEFGQPETTYRLRDWSIGRQRFWGTPIPIVYDPDGNPHVVPKEHLPWELPSDIPYEKAQEAGGRAPLWLSGELKERTEEIFGEGWTPEVDTMDTFVDSSWYWLRFADPENAEEFASEEAVENWCPVDMYVGGAEHTVLHLLYARFITKALQDMGAITFAEPFKKLRHQGMILAEDGRKMSKSLGNVVNPDDVVERFGADTIRLFELFLGPFADEKPWDTDSIVGPRRFIEKVWRQSFAVDEKTSEKAQQTLHQTIQKVTDDLSGFRFNTAIAALMECANTFADEAVSAKDYKTFLQLLAPFAPHVTEELWHELGETESIHLSEWPEADEELAQETTVTVAVQVDGKVRAQCELPVNADENEALETAADLDDVAKWLDGKEIVRKIYVPNKIINFVTAD